MTTVLETMVTDQDLFLDITENPAAKTAIWTPQGDVAQPSFVVLYLNVPLHGDENQELAVEQPDTVIQAKNTDVSGIKKNDGINVAGVNYEVINAPYPFEADNLWSIIDLRLPRNSETGI
jgi:hypothetical protein